MSAKKILFSTAAVAAFSTLGVSAPAQAGTNPFVGEILPVGFNFCPRGYANADGQLLAISTNSALFSLYGTTYGGDGRTTFGLPDLRGRAALHTGNGPGLSSRPQGQKSGTETNVMTINQMPSHTHQAGIQTVDAPADRASPKSDAFANTPGINNYSDTAPAGNFMHAQTVVVQNTGGNQPQNNMQPFQVIRYCVALVGVYPSRS